MSITKKSVLFFILPARIGFIFTVLSLIKAIDVSWEVDYLAFVIFFPIYIGTFFIEGLLKDGGFKKNFAMLSTKYIMGVPIEFVAVAAGALLAFASKPDDVWMLRVYTAIVAITSTVLIEMYFHFAVPKLVKITLSAKQEILIIIPFSVFLVLFGIKFINFKVILGLFGVSL